MSQKKKSMREMPRIAGRAATHNSKGTLHRPNVMSSMSSLARIRAAASIQVTHLRVEGSQNSLTIVCKHMLSYSAATVAAASSNPPHEEQQMPKQHQQMPQPLQQRRQEQHR